MEIGMSFRSPRGKADFPIWGGSTQGLSKDTGNAFAKAGGKPKGLA